MNRQKIETILLEKLRLMWEPFTVRLPIKYSVDQALVALKEYSDNNSHNFIHDANALVSNSYFPSTSEKEDGMNSPGILWDRLTILNCKYFFTSPTSPHFDSKIHSKEVDIGSELMSVLNALHSARPPRHVLLAKEATQRQTVAPDIGTSLCQLQYSNLAMWINQDLLYTVSADDVEPKRLREYIKFFSEANKIRNTAIEHIELFYSKNLLSANIRVV